jgi:hypothetical protein
MSSTPKLYAHQSVLRRPCIPFRLSFNHLDAGPLDQADAAIHVS